MKKQELVIYFINLFLFIFSYDISFAQKPVHSGEIYYLRAIDDFKKGNYHQAVVNFNIAKKTNFQASDLEEKLNMAKACEDNSSKYSKNLQAGLLTAARVSLAKVLAVNSYDKNAKSIMSQLNTLFRKKPYNMVYINGMELEDKVITDFYISKTEITVKQYVDFLNLRKPSKIEALSWINLGEKYQICLQNDKYVVNEGQANFPIRYISWEGAEAYAHFYDANLPSEDEWNMAALRITQSDNMDEYAWTIENSGGKVHEIKTKKPLSGGIYDLWGNVWEWTSSEYHDPALYTGIPKKIVKGGSYAIAAERMIDLKNYYLQTEKLSNVGFRIIKKIKL